MRPEGGPGPGRRRGGGTEEACPLGEGASLGSRFLCGSRLGARPTFGQKSLSWAWALRMGGGQGVEATQVRGAQKSACGKQWEGKHVRAQVSGNSSSAVSHFVNERTVVQRREGRCLILRAAGELELGVPACCLCSGTGTVCSCACARMLTYENMMVGLHTVNLGVLVWRAGGGGIKGAGVRSSCLRLSMCRTPSCASLGPTQGRRYPTPPSASSLVAVLMPCTSFKPCRYNPNGGAPQPCPPTLLNWKGSLSPDQWEGAVSCPLLYSETQVCLRPYSLHLV